MSKIFSIKLVLAILILLCLGIMVVSISKKRTSNEMVQEQLSTKYDATKDIEEAMNKLNTDKKESKVLTNVNTLDKVVAITFLGLTDIDTNNKIIDILASYNTKATFMVPGILAAEDTNFIKKINKEGHRIGSNGLSGERHLEKLTREEVVKEFAKTNTIIKSITNKSPSILQATSTVYTKELLQVSYACGYDFVVKSTHFLNYQSFINYEQVLDYVKGLAKGSIVTIKMNGVLDEMEYIKETEEIKEQNVTDNQIGTQVDLGTQEERLVHLVEWMVRAFDETNYEAVFVEELLNYEDIDF